MVVAEPHDFVEFGCVGVISEGAKQATGLDRVELGWVAQGADDCAAFVGDGHQGVPVGGAHHRGFVDQQHGAGPEGSWVEDGAGGDPFVGHLPAIGVGQVRNREPLDANFFAQVLGGDR